MAAEDFISDQDMAKHVAAGTAKASNPPEFISDDDMDAYQSQQTKGALLAGSEHLGNSIFQGYGPQAAAASEPLTSKLGDLITGQHVADDLPDYVHRRDENISRLKQQEKDHPTASTVGTVAGTVASSLPAGAALSKIPALSQLGAMAAPEGASLVARGTALAGRTLGSALSAGAQGLASNPGDTEGEVAPLQLGDRLKSGVSSAAIAAPLHLAGEGASALGSYLAPKLKETAERLAFRALGPYKRQVNQNRDEIQDIGRAALDNGVVNWVPRNAEGIEDRAMTAAKGAGQKLGDLTDELSGLENESTQSGISRSQMVDNLKKKLMPESDVPGIQDRNDQFQKWIQEFAQDPAVKKLAAKMDLSYEDAAKLAGMSGYKPQPMSFQDMRKMKMDIGGTKSQEGLINWNRLKNADIPEREQFHRALYGEMRKGEEAGADAIEKAYYGQSSNRFNTAKDQFANLESAAQIAGNRADAQRANHILGLRDAIFAAGGGAVGGAALGGAAGEITGGKDDALQGAKIGAAIGGIGSKLSRDYGPQVGAKMSDALSQLLSQSPKLQQVLQKYPNVLPQLIKSLQAPEKRSSGAGTQSGGAPQAPKKDSQVQGNPNEMPMELDQAREMHRQGN